MNILVTGANGQLGTEMRNAALNSPHHFIFSDVNSIPGVETLYLDITDAESLKTVMESERVDTVVNCAAYTNVDKAEDDIEMADLLNHKAPETIARVCAATGASLIHISTDYVFDGEGCTPVCESDTPSPKSVYGSTKLAGEIAVRSHLPENSVIIRTAWLYSPYGKNFVKTMRSLMESRPGIKVVFDQVGTPTYAKDLAASVMAVIQKGVAGNAGIYHFSDEGAVSWYDFAKSIQRLSGLGSCKVEPCLSAEFPSKVHRPHFSVLDKALIKKTFGITIPYWEDSLADCISRL